jgi:Spy/CpxP family protein refolding chaperone
MKLRLLILGMLLLITGASYGQEMKNNKNAMAKDVEMKEKIQTRKIAFITSELDLTPEEAQLFWPIYNDYQDEMEKLRKENRPEKKRLEEMTDADAAKLIESRMNIEEKELVLKRTFIKDMQPVLPTKKVAKLLMVERDFKSKMLSTIKERYNRKGEVERRKMNEKERKQKNEDK